MERREVRLDPGVAAILSPSSGPGPVEREEERRGRSTRRTPHEAGRSARMVGVSFPSGEWRDAVAGLARRWGCRVSDVMVFAVAHLMAGVEAGEVGQPGGEVEGWQRSGEGLELPWEP